MLPPRTDGRFWNAAGGSTEKYCIKYMRRRALFQDRRSALLIDLLGSYIGRHAFGITQAAARRKCVCARIRMWSTDCQIAAGTG